MIRGEKKRNKAPVGNFGAINEVGILAYVLEALN